MYILTIFQQQSSAFMTKMYTTFIAKATLTSHIRPGYREKLADLQGTLKLHMQFYNRISRLQRPRNKNWHAHYSLNALSMATNASISQGNLRETRASAFSLLVLHIPPVT